jgi:hypothetical protein
MTPGRGKLRFAKALRLDPLEAGIHDADELQRRENPPRQRPQDVCLLRVVDIQPVLAQYADLEGDLLNLLQRLPAKEPHGIQQVGDRIHAWSAGLELSHGDLSKLAPGQYAQVIVSYPLPLFIPPFF